MTMEADWIFTDASIWRGGAASDSEGAGGSTRGSALALRGGSILALGTEEEVLRHRGPDTAFLTLGGRFVMPGFVDAHVHLLTAGLRMFRVDLRGARSRQEFMQRVADRTRITPTGEWILGGDWNQQEWGGEFPAREWLDRVTPDHPVFLQRMDLHLGLANSHALRLAGIGPDTPDPESGRIDRDPVTGEPTGILRERAMLPIYDVIPELSDDDCIAAMRASALAALSRGVTQVHDMGAVQKLSESWQALKVFRRLDGEGRLPIRVNSALPLAHWPRVAELVAKEGRGSGRVRWGGVKGFVDGSFGSSTAWFHEPYLHEPDSHGTPICDLDELRKDLVGAVGAGLQAVVHVIGDRANDWFLGVCRELDRLAPEAAARIRVEHAQHLTEVAIAEMGRSRRILSVQPAHILDDAPWIPMKLGTERGGRAYAFRTLEEAGARLAMGSDWPVAAMDPLMAVWTAVNRLLPEGAGEGGGAGWNPDERMALDAALRAHSWGGAVAGGTENETGSLAPGKVGDFIVLSADPFQVGPERIFQDVKVEMTFVDGILVYRREGLEEEPRAPTPARTA